MPQKQSAQSLAYVRCPVAATLNGVAYTPTADIVAFAFTAPNTDPTSGQWVAGAWETDPVRGIFYAICLLGPGGVTALGVGRWDVWVRVTDNPEIPAERVDTLTIY